MSYWRWRWSWTYRAASPFIASVMGFGESGCEAKAGAGEVPVVNNDAAMTRTIGCHVSPVNPDRTLANEAVGKRVSDLGDALGFLAVTVEAPVDIGSAA
jgi:hypothetical protein